MADLEGKRILYLGPPFFGYENDIQEELVRQGAEVDFYNERVFTSSLGKILIRLDFKFFINKKIEKHYEEIISVAAKQAYDYLFVVSPETLEIEFLAGLKKVNPGIKTLLYMWDALGNKKNSRELIPFFDKVWTFDPNDHVGMPEVGFLPLFFVPDFASIMSSRAKYSVSFIGTIHSDRYRLVKDIVQQYDDVSLPVFTFFYCPSKLLFVLKKIFTSEYAGVSLKDVSFKSLTKSEVFDIISVSETIIDIEHPAQNGLTMRTIEMLSSGRKLITTNSNVTNYDFYAANNICVVDRKDPVVSKEFKSNSYMKIDSELVDYYSLENWVKNIFVSGG